MLRYGPLLASQMDKNRNQSQSKWFVDLLLYLVLEEPLPINQKKTVTFCVISPSFLLLFGVCEQIGIRGFFLKMI